MEQARASEPVGSRAPHRSAASRYREDPKARRGLHPRVAPARLRQHLWAQPALTVRVRLNLDSPSSVAWRSCSKRSPREVSAAKRRDGAMQPEPLRQLPFVLSRSLRSCLSLVKNPMVVSNIFLE